MEQKPVYVKLDEYKNILSVIDALKGQVANAKHTLADIRKLKKEEDVELEIWETVIAEIERRTDFMEHTLTEPERM